MSKQLGGATASIGDPSGKTKSSLAQLENDQVVANTNQIKSQIESLFERLLPHARSRLGSSPEINSNIQPLRVMNNLDWTRSVSVLDFLRDVGRHVRVPQMISRESVKRRFEVGMGISYAEFSYQLLQARDWEYLYNTYGCSVQIGGTDQIGNITTGIDLCLKKRNIRQQEPQQPHSSEDDNQGLYGITVPLLTTSKGVKFGKSEGNALFIDPSLTSPYELYQYFLRLDDISVEKYLKTLTFLPLDVLEQEIQKHQLSKNERSAQILLANEFTELIHGKKGLDQAIKGTRIMYNYDADPDSLKSLKVSDLQALPTKFQHMVSSAQNLHSVTVEALIVQAELASGLSNARRKITDGAVKLSGHPVTQLNQTPQKDHLIDDRFITLKVGKNQAFFIIA